MASTRQRAATAALISTGLALGFALAPAAQARDGYVTSFDGTKIVYSFFPSTQLKAGQRAPSLMFGPGYSSSRAGASDATVKALLGAGYNVLAWDPRGFGDSGGNVEIDSPDYDARDVSALINMLARQPEVELDSPGDPHFGMVGASYGGGIQFATAETDPRVDVIAPQIAWNSLVTSLGKSNTAKGGWGAILFGLGIEGTTVPGITGGLSGQPAGFQFGRQQDPETTSALIAGLSTGRFTPSSRRSLPSADPPACSARSMSPRCSCRATTRCSRCTRRSRTTACCEPTGYRSRCCGSAAR